MNANMHIFKISHPHNQKMHFFCHWRKIFFFTAQSGRRVVSLSFFGWKLLSVRPLLLPPRRQHCMFPFISGREQSDIVSFLWWDKAKQQQQQQKRKTHTQCSVMMVGIISHSAIIEPIKSPFVDWQPSQRAAGSS